MHIDVHPDDASAHVHELERLGAVRTGAPTTAYGVEWQTMVDPEGHEFCVVAHGRLESHQPEGDT